MSETTKPTALAILGDGYTITVTPAAEAQKQTIIEAARRVVAVTDQDTCDLANARIKALASVRNTVEQSRTKVKAPVIELGRTIDNIAKSFVADVIIEESRLSALVSDYAREVQRKAREDREAAERERQRIERIEHERKMDALRAEQEAERQRMQAEREAHLAEMQRLEAARNADAQAQFDAQQRAEAARRQQEEATRRAQEAQAEQERATREAEAQAAAVAVPALPALPTGVTETVDFLVEDIALFYSKFPQLCEVTVKRAEVLKQIKKSLAKNGKLPTVPGLKIFQNIKPKAR
jgi:chromosome segregation ATPase